MKITASQVARLEFLARVTDILKGMSCIWWPRLYALKPRLPVSAVFTIAVGCYLETRQSSLANVDESGSVPRQSRAMF